MSKTPGQAAAALGAVAIADTLSSAVRAAAERLVEAVRGELAGMPGDVHDTPWRVTGALQESIAASCEGLKAEIGSNDPAAAPQELGTARIPPRPFLAPAAAALAEPIAHDIAEALAAALSRALA